MKKHKSPDRPRSEFNNNPFKSLKGLKASAKTGPSKETKSPRKETGEDDADLFTRAVSGVRSLNPETVNQEAGKKALKREPARWEDEERELFVQAMRSIGTRLRETGAKQETEESDRRSRTGRLKQLKRGTIRIREELDLHGHVRDEALVQLERFIASAYRRGLEAVLVITGKGINSAEGPVLQGAVAQWLREKGKQMAAEFAPAPRDKGGSGAFVVFLRSNQQARNE